jgi:predicted Zn-dependent protease
MPRSARLVAAALAALVALSCATNPATGKKQLAFFGEEQELAMGRDADADLLSKVAVYSDDDLGAYVADVGGRLAATSERPYLPWRFVVLDDPTVNAFSLPGGYVYVTRGILAHLDSEAELAAVLGHEIGHVTARHGVHAMSEQLLATAALGTAAVVLDPEHADDWMGVGSLTLGLVFLKHSRDDERQADDLGLRYLLRAGYDPAQMPLVFEMLDQVAQAEGGRLPIWLSTHPDPGARAQRVAKEVAAAKAAGETAAQPRIARASFLARLDGLDYGAPPGDAADDGGMTSGDGASSEPPPGPAAARLALVHLEHGMPLREFVARYPSIVPLPEVALLNRVPIDGDLPDGCIAKRVVPREP